MEVWTLEDALDLIRILQPHTRQFHYHLCLGGGVLNNGKSEKDLDLYFLPMDNGAGVDTFGLLKWIGSIWGEGFDIRTNQRLELNDDVKTISFRPVFTRSGRTSLDDDYNDGGNPEKCYVHKLKYDWSGLRIDVFIIGTGE